LSNKSARFCYAADEHKIIRSGSTVEDIVDCVAAAIWTKHRRRTDNGWTWSGRGRGPFSGDWPRRSTHFDQVEQQIQPKSQQIHHRVWFTGSLLCSSHCLSM